MSGYGYGCFTFFITVFTFGSIDALIYFAAYLYKQDKMSVGEFASFQFYMFTFLLNMTTVATVIG